MKAIFDCPGSNRTHGYVIGPDEDWYFTWDGTEATIRTDGYHTDHPIKTEGVPEDVKAFAQRACEEREPNTHPEPAPYCGQA